MTVALVGGFDDVWYVVVIMSVFFGAKWLLLHKPFFT